MEEFRKYAIKFGIAVGVLILGIILIKLIIYTTRKILVRAHIDKAASTFILSLIKALMWVLIIFVIGYILGVPITALVAIVSAATVAIGLALQGSLSNLASGIIIAITKPFIEGDFVDTGVVNGKVIDIKLFNTELLTIDNKKVIVPNSTITASNITNFTNQKDRMVNLLVPVAYGADLRKVREVLNSIADGNSLVERELPIIIELHEYNESSVSYTFRVWVKTERYWELYWWLREEIIIRFRENDIEIPFNKIDVKII